MIFKKFSWLLKRHPFLYVARFKLLSKNTNKGDVDNHYYNQINKIKDIPQYYSEINNLIFINGRPESDFEFIKQLSIWLQNNIKGGPGLSEPSELALRIMLNGKGGVCSDMAQVFNNFCVINSIKVREWGNTRAPFDKEYGGHSFNEVFSNTLNKWVLIDVYHGVFFYFEDDDVPLSVLELYDGFPNKRDLCFKSFNTVKGSNDMNISNNYLHPDTIPFLICNYSNKTYDSYLKRTRPHVPVFVTHFILYLFGKSYKYSFPYGDYKQIFS
jgi:hypothetical protein